MCRILPCQATPPRGSQTEREATEGVAQGLLCALTRMRDVSPQVVTEDNLGGLTGNVVPVEP